MATAEQPPRLTIRPARREDAPALREIFNDAVEDGLATFDSTLRNELQRHMAAIGVKFITDSHVCCCS